MRAFRRSGWREGRSHGAILLGVGVLAAAVAPACGDDSVDDGSGTTSAATTASASTGGTPSSTNVGPGSGGQGGEGSGGAPTGPGSGGGGAGGEGGGPPITTCDVVASGATRGSAIALSEDDSTLVSVNRDVGTVTVTRVTYEDDLPVLEKIAELDVGAEPWQVAMDACGTRAYVTSRAEQRVVEILDLDTDTPTVGASVDVGSEPTGIAISPANSRLYVANWVEGTVSVIATADMDVVDTIDLNATLAATGLLGDVAARPALAHPRALAVTNDGDIDDDDERVLVTEWFAQRTDPESADGRNSDVNKQGLLYVIDASDGSASTLDLPSIADVGINNRLNQATGCFPNQVGSVTIEGGFAYVTSVCASPVGPIGVFAPSPAPACTVATQEANCGFGGTCNPGTLTCNPNTQDVKTTTHPALHVVDLATGDATATALDARFSDPAVASARMPHLPSDLGFFNGFAYVTGMGADAAFRLTVEDGAVSAVGSAANDFINLRVDSNDITIRLPIGIATAHGEQAFGFVANDGSRDVTAVAFNTQTIAGAPSDPRILQAADLPGKDTPAEAALRGKRFFNTGLGRWSLRGEAWGSCAACHIDGLTDNVTWYFARGPRQSTSLDGSFDSANPDDRRIFNWTAIFDESADFELNTRGVSGGLGAIVAPADTRIDLLNQTPPQQGLQGSAADAADPDGASPHPHSVLNDWAEIDAYMKTIRSPRGPVGLSAADVAEGRAIFASEASGNCVGCHSGGKWTISRVFYEPGDVPNAATNSVDPTSLGVVSWNVALNGFPADLLPASPAEVSAGNTRMRFGAPPGAEQIQCILRPVGTFGVDVNGISPAAVNVRELRQDMSTLAQGGAATGRGFNPPSLLGLSVGAPFYHAGNARTLEEAFDDLFAGHHQSAVASVFDPTDEQKRLLVAFLLSIDESTETEAIPPKGPTGGDLCFYP